ncbi:HlyD family secretion protein, partial [Actibacterium sp.]|uniref:HlyD family secretion protein n=1 Tax=Actibacterium sp. TaxID=1872125 RepID=UPI0035621C7A
MIAPLVLLAGMTLFQNWADYSRDILVLLGSYLTVTRMLIGLVTVNLVSRLAQGVAISSAGGEVKEFGIRLSLGVVPRFFIDVTQIRSLDRRGQLWAYGAPLLSRLSLFAGGIVVWAMYRDGGTWLPELALIISQFGMTMFLFSSLPLIPGDGLRWLTTYYGDPALIEKTAIVARQRLSGKPLPPFIDKSDAKPLVFFAISIVLSVCALLGGMTTYAAIAFERQLGGLGVTVFLALFASFLLNLISMRATGGRATGAAGLMGGLLQPQPEAELQPETDTSLLSKAQVLWAVIGVVLLGLAFLPYHYEAGGTVEILPSTRSHAVARNNGEIVQIYVNEGDLVEPGQMIAQLSSWKEESDIAVTESSLEKARAELAQLNAGAKPEEIELSRRRVESAQTELAFATAEAERNAELLKTGTVTQRDWEKAKSELDARSSDLAVAQAQLDLVMSGATREQILVAEADVKRLEIQLEYQKGELERTRILAPTRGRVVTKNIQLMYGQYLETGHTLLEIETVDRVHAEIAVPEADIALLQVGDPVRFKAYGQSSAQILGAVSAIAPSAEERQYGRVVRVEAVFDNSDGLLRSSMTGYAKVEGAEMRVWEAFLRRIVRFFQIEVWSWIP